MDQIHERWNETDGSLQATVEAKDFMGVIDMVLRIAELAEEQNHHPDLLIHDYKYLTITLKSHDADEVTERDYKLGQAIDELLGDSG